MPGVRVEWHGHAEAFGGPHDHECSTAVGLCVADYFPWSLSSFNKSYVSHLAQGEGCSSVVVRGWEVYLKASFSWSFLQSLEEVASLKMLPLPLPRPLTQGWTLPSELHCSLVQ